jgi:NO-binding membrane sensor protein with MHYT domain
LSRSNLNFVYLIIFPDLNLGGVAIFCMHFVGMGSIMLRTEDNTIVPISFDLVLTAMSLIASVTFVYFGLEISLADRAYKRNKQQIAEMTEQDARGMTIQQLRKTNLIALALFKKPLPLIMGGLVTASGIIVMHYIGMRAVVFPGRIEWNVGAIIASVIIAIITSIAAFWILFRLLALYPHSELFRLCGSILMAVAVAGMHYTGAQAATFNYQPDLALPVLMGSVSSEVAVSIVLTVGILYPFFIVFMMFADIRAWLHLRTRTIDKIDALVKSHQESLSNNPDRRIDLEAFVAQYAAIGKSGSTENKRVTPHHLEEIAVWTPTYCLGHIKERIAPAARYTTTEPVEIPMPHAPPNSVAK